MTDRYGTFVASPLGRRLTGALGLPQPVELRRHTPGDPVLPGSVLVLGATPAAADARTLLASWGLEVADAPREGARHAAIVACFDGVATPADLGAVALEIGGALRSLGSSSRVVTVFEDPEAATDPTLRAARQGVTGLTRSIAHEMRRGGTANGLVLGEGVPLTAPGAAGALAFLLSGRTCLLYTSDAADE